MLLVSLSHCQPERWEVQPLETVDNSISSWVLRLEMVDKLTSLLHTHFGRFLGYVAVQRGPLFQERGSIRMLLRAHAPTSPRSTTAPTSGFGASQAEPFGKGHVLWSLEHRQRFCLIRYQKMYMWCRSLLSHRSTHAAQQSSIMVALTPLQKRCGRVFLPWLYPGGSISSLLQLKLNGLA